MRLLRTFVFFASFVSLSAAAFAQTETGRITGTVTDPQAGVVPGVNVTATATATGQVRSTVTDGEGRYVLANLQPTAYELKFNISGFKGITMKVTIQVGQAVAVDAKLELGGATETVNVSGAPEIINLANAEVSTIVNERQIQEMPLLTRNPYDLVALSGNVQEQPYDQVANGGTRGAGFNINGARASGTNVLLDGSANNDEFDTSVGQSVPLDSVQEFSIVTNNFSAQYGRASGGIVNVITKSGTNAFRGTAYEFFRSEKLSANSPDNIANQVEKGQFTRHMPGFSFGGPIARDKAHFFTSLEYIRVRSSDTIFSWVPTPQFLAASSPATQAYFRAYDKGVGTIGSTLTRGQVAGIIGAGAGAFNSLPDSLPVFGRVTKSLPIDAGGGDPQNQTQFVGRVDWNMGPSTLAYIRYALQNLAAEEGTNSASPYTGYDTGYVNKNHSFLASFTHVYSPSMTSQTKVVFNRLLNEQPITGPNVPRLMMNPSGPVSLQGYRIAFPGFLPWNPGSDIPFGGPQNLFQLYHDQTVLKGSHDLRFGGSYVNIADNRTFSAYSNAVEALSISSNSLNSLNNFVTGNIQRFQAAINPQGYPGGTYTTPVSQPSFTSHNRYNELALYLQDNLSVGSRVRLNLGVRWEYYGPQQKSDPKHDSNYYWGNPDLDLSNATSLAIIQSITTGAIKPSNESPTGSLWKADKNNFAPRLGFAWDVNGDGKTSVRGGYGIAYERNFGNVTFNTLFNAPLYLIATIDTPADLASQSIYVDNSGPFGGVAGVKKTIPLGGMRHIDQNIKTAYVHQYGFSMQREVRPGLVGSIEYNGSTGRDLYDLADVNKRGGPLVYGGDAAVAASRAILAPAFAQPSSANLRANPNFGAFNSRGNRGTSQYHGVTLGLDGNLIGSTGLSFTTKYTISQAKDNLSTTFSEGNNGFYNLGYLDAFNPMLDYGYAEFDVRQRLLFSTIWNLPFMNAAGGMKETLLGGWSINAIFTARSGYPFTVYDCTNQFIVCMRAVDAVGVNKLANGSTATGNPNEFTLLDLTSILPMAGSYAHPLTGNTDYGPYPANMTERNAFRGPGGWNMDFSMIKRFRFANGRAAQLRVELYNATNHETMYVRGDNTDISGTSKITGFLEGNRRAQIGFKFEF